MPGALRERHRRTFPSLPSEPTMSTPIARRPTTVASRPTAAPPPAAQKPTTTQPAATQKPTTTQTPAATQTPATTSVPASKPPKFGVRDTFSAAAPAAALVLNPAAAPPPPVTVGAAKPPPAPKSLSGEDRARQDVELQTVDKRRADVLGTQKKLGAETTKQIDDLFAIADGKAAPPAGTQVKRLSPTEAELVRKNAQGQVVEHTLATKKDGALNLNTATFANGVNTRAQVEVSADGASTRVRNAEWKSPTNETAVLKPFEALAAVRDPNLTLTDNQVRPEGTNLVTEEFAQANGGVKGSKTVILEGKGGGGIDDKLEGPFDFDKPVGRADTYSYSIPPPGADGSQGNPTFQRVQRYSQDGVQATSIVNRDLDGHKQFAGEGAHTREDFERVRAEYIQDDGENYDANDGTEEGKTPKQWVVERKKDENSLDTQTFIEGSPKATTVTHRTREGSQVKESFSGKAFKPDSSDLADVSGESVRAYAQDGSLEKLDSKSQEPDGTRLEQHYASTRTPTAQGLVLGSTLDTRREKEGQSHSSKLEERSLLSDKGVQLLNSRSTVTGPDGRQAVSAVDDRGETLTLTNPEGKDPRVITDPQVLGDDAVDQDLTLQASAATASSIQGYAANGGAQSLLLLQGLSKDASKLPLPASVSKLFGSDKVQGVLQGAKGGATALAGAAGAVAGGLNFIQGIRDQNVTASLKGAYDTYSGAKSVYEGGKSILQAFKGVSDLADTAASTVGTAGTASTVSKLGSWLSKAPGVSAVTNVGSKVASALEGVGGAANVVGAVVGTAAGIKEIVDGAEGGHTGQIAKGAVNIVGSVGGAAAGILAASAAGGPVGLVVGAGIGLLTLGVNKVVDLITDDKHQIAKLQLD